MFAVAFRLMKDLGFTPVPATHPLHATREVLSESIEYGLKKPPVRYLMLAAPFTAGVGVYAFYALQPYLLELYGDPSAYTVAGLAAALLAGMQIVGGYLAPRFRKLFHKRTTLLIVSAVVSSVILLLLGLTNAFWVALVLVSLWGLIFAADMPIRQAYLNDMIPSKQRATVLSFDSLMGSSGGVVIQPILGRVADVYSYGTSFVVSSAFQIAAAPFLLASRRQGAAADAGIQVTPGPVPVPSSRATERTHHSLLDRLPGKISGLAPGNQPSGDGGDERDADRDRHQLEDRDPV